MDLAEGRRSLRNKRFVFHPHKNPEEAASELFSGSGFKNAALNLLPKYLLVDGAFNVNSTSVKAWAAMLASVRQQEILTGSGSKKEFEHPFGTLGYAANQATTGTAGDWEGLRSLSDSEINTLAESIVKEVKERGPFLSMADFVNRRPDADSPEHKALGALQAAINRAGLNNRMSTGNRAVSAADFAGLAGGDLISNEVAPSKALGSRGYLTQADVLTALGPQIAVRSDSFIIRAYGDARDASGKNVVAKAWCEAVVQRIPEYVDPADEPEAEDGWGGTSGDFSETNKKFGRRFEVRSFRWISAEEV